MRTHPAFTLLAIAVSCLALAGCTTRTVATTTTTTTMDPSGPRVLNVETAAEPGAGKVATTVLHESATAVSRIMRLAPGSVIAEHHHPSHDETFFVHRGTVVAVLDGREHTVRAGDLVHIPAGTVIVGRNAGSDEAIVIVAFAGNGRGGPLTVPGHPTH